MGRSTAATRGLFRVGAVTIQKSLHPHGTATRTGSTSTRLLFGGGYTDAETGYIYLTNRYYDPVTGLFTTIDPAIAATGDPYAYAGNNPSMANDPLGLWWTPGQWAAAGAGVGLAAGLVAGCVFTGCLASGVLIAGAGGASVGVVAGAATAAGWAGLAGAGVGAATGLGIAAAGTLYNETAGPDCDSGDPELPGANGTQVTSKTIAEGKDGGYRIDVENPNPGQRAGQIHFQKGTDKYLYDFETGEFRGMPKNLAKKIAKDPIAQDAIRKGLKYLGMQP